MNAEISTDAVLTFADGLPGFESCRRFVLIESPALSPFQLIQGLHPDGPSFVGIDPRRVEPAYRARLDQVDLARLGATPADPLLWLAVVSAPEGEPATANLRAPLVINPKAMRGIQLLPPDSPYRVDHPLPVE
jgi:flagellar assembly factor FliW